jgi:hypothetical protein
MCSHGMNVVWRDPCRMDRRHHPLPCCRLHRHQPADGSHKLPVTVARSGSVATSGTFVCPGKQNGAAGLGDLGIRTIFHRRPIIGSRRPQGRVKLREYVGKPGKAAAEHRIEPRRPSDEAQRPAADGVHARYGARLPARTAVGFYHPFLRPASCQDQLR